MTTTPPLNGSPRPPAPPIVVVEQPVVVTDQATVDTKLETPSLADVILQEMQHRAACYAEQPEAMISWEALKAELKASR
jgi:hypothetical protein